MRAARNGAGTWDGRDLIWEPSRGDVLLALGPGAGGGVGNLRSALVGQGSKSRVSAVANCSPLPLSAAAKLFTTFGIRALRPERCLRWCITLESISGSISTYGVYREGLRRGSGAVPARMGCANAVGSKVATLGCRKGPDWVGELSDSRRSTSAAASRKTHQDDFYSSHPGP